MKRSHIICAVGWGAVVLLCLSGSVFGTQIHYSLTDLGENWDNPVYPDLLAYQAAAINNNVNPVVVGTASVGETSVVGFEWQNDDINALSTSPKNFKYVHNVNDNGGIIGSSGSGFNIIRYTAPSTRETLGHLYYAPEGYQYTAGSAYGLNNTGDAAGYSIAGSGTDAPHNRAVFWESGSTTAVDLGVPYGGTGYSRAFNVNDSQDVVGQYYIEGPTGGNICKAAIWHYGSGGGTTAFELSTPSGLSSSAVDINGAQTCVGSMDAGEDPYYYVPVVWPSAGTGLPLQTSGDFVGGDANAVNNAGTIVGKTFIPYVDQRHASIWDYDDVGGTWSLRYLDEWINSTGHEWILYDAVDLNDQGDIVGIGYKIGDDPMETGYRSFMLTASENEHPWSYAGGPYEWAVGDDPLTLSGSGTLDDSPLAGLEFKWDLDNNGSYETLGMDVNLVDPMFTFGGVGEYSVGLQVYDGQYYDYAETTVTVLVPEPPSWLLCALFILGILVLQRTCRGSQLGF